MKMFAMFKYVAAAMVGGVILSTSAQAGLVVQITSGATTVDSVNNPGLFTFTTNQISWNIATVGDFTTVGSAAFDNSPGNGVDGATLTVQAKGTWDGGGSDVITFRAWDNTFTTPVGVPVFIYFVNRDLNCDHVGYVDQYFVDQFAPSVRRRSDSLQPIRNSGDAPRHQRQQQYDR